MPQNRRKIKFVLYCEYQFNKNRDTVNSLCELSNGYVVCGLEHSFEIIKINEKKTIEKLKIIHVSQGKVSTILK